MVGCQAELEGAMGRDTRELFLDTAEELFAERGFYGVSIAAIADELDLTKQALLHHFGSKEKLYGEVLARISVEFEAMIKKAAADPGDPVRQLTTFFMQLQSPENWRLRRTQLLIRELLDNRRRAEKAGAWYLKPFLESLIVMVQSVPNWEKASDAEALAIAYQWLGAINYFAISGPTLSGIFGKKRLEELTNVHTLMLERQIILTLKAR